MYKTNQTPVTTLEYMDSQIEQHLASPARFDTKIAVVLRDDLEPWQELNVCAFRVSGVAATTPESIGDSYKDADGAEYNPMFRQPVLVFSATEEAIHKSYSRAKERNVAISIFTADLFSTNNDVDNRAAVAKVPGSDLDVVGIALHAKKNAVDKIIKGARMHR